MLRALAMCLLFGAVAGCTIERFHRDVRVTTDYARFTHSTTVHQDARWQLSPGMRIGVVEVAPAKQQAWLPAAQAGINSVFTLSQHEHAAVAPDLTLLVSWPSDRVAGQPERGYGKYLRVDKMAIGDQLPVQVALVDQRRDVLIQTATLKLTPRMFASNPTGADHIQEAFASYAMGLVGRR